MKNAICFLLAVCAVQTLQAGDKILNGGNVIVCGNKVELLDYYEARLSGKKLQFDPGAATYSEKINQMFTRWEKVAPLRMRLYKGWLNQFESEAGIYSGIEIPEIQDTGTVAIPSGCKMIPAAFQRRDEDIFPGEKRYVINKDLWDLMSQDQKAGLVLHEIIYREAIKNGHSTSLPTRYFNGFLATEINPEIEKYFAIAYKMPLAWAEYSGMKIRIGRFYCNDGTFGSPGCRFNYTSIHDSKEDRDYVMSLSIEEIFSDISTKDLSAKFYFYPCELQAGASYTKRRVDNKVYFNGCKFTKDINLKNVMNVTDMEIDNEQQNIVVSIGEIRPRDNYASDFIVKVNPETSWFQHESGERIEKFNAFGRFNHSFVWQKEGTFWSFSPMKNKFTELSYNIEFNKKNFNCYVNLDSFNKNVLQCPELPQTFSCKVKVITPYLEGTGWESTSVKILGKSIFVKNFPDSEKSISDYYVKIPKGQTTSFLKKRSGKLEPQSASKDFWAHVTWDGSGCFLEDN